MRSTPKPGCSPEIISYFRGQLGKPSTLRGQIHEATDAIKRLEEADEDEIMGKYIADMEQQPLLGPVAGRKEERSKGDALRDKMVLHQASSSLRTAEKEHHVLRAEAETDGKAEEPLRILVIGDRLFTDTLLAHRLSVTLPKPTSSLPSVLSIHTTTLPQPKDVRFLRWIEDKLSQRRLKEGPTDWGRYVRDPYADMSIPPLAQIEAQPKVTLKERWNDLKEDVARSKLQWDPRTWRVFDLAIGAGRGTRWLGRKFWALVRQDGEVFRQAMSAPKEEAKAVQAVIPPAASTEKSIKPTA
jgi:phosphatidylglycerophosphatase GEP4